MQAKFCIAINLWAAMKGKQDKMDWRERIDALFVGKTPDRVPLGAMSTGFNTVNAGYTAAQAYTDPDVSFESMVWTSEQYAWDPVPQYSGHTVLGITDFGGEVRMPEGPYEGAMVVKRHPVENESDIDNLQLPDPKTAGRIPLAMAFARHQQKHGLPVYFFSRSPMTMAATITSLENFLKWMYKKPQLCERLTRLAMEHIFNVLKVWVDAFGTDQLFVWMSSPSESNQVISPKFFEKFALAWHIEYHERLKDLGIRRFGFHICGEQNKNLPIFAEASPWKHPAVLSFGHEVDIESAAKIFPHDIIFGNIEPAIIQTARPATIYEQCRKIIEKGKKAPGGFILGPGCGLPPTAPPVNVYAMTRATLDFGWY